MMTYSVALRIGLLSSCYWHSSGWPIVYPRDASGNDGWLKNDDIIQIIDYCGNPDGLGFSEIETWLEFKEVESGAITIRGKSVKSGFDPSWTWSYGCWFGWPCCSKGEPASLLLENATIEARVYFGSPVNLYSEPARITIGDPSRRAQIESASARWKSRNKLEVEVTAKNLIEGENYTAYIINESANINITPPIDPESHTARTLILDPPPVSELYVYLKRDGSMVYTDMKRVEVPEFRCEDITNAADCKSTPGCYYYDGKCHSEPQCSEGETRCKNYDLYECKDGVWQLKERQSPACGYEKRPSPCPPYGDLDDDGYVTYNDIILAWLYELYNDWDAVKEKTTLSEEEFKHRADVNGDGKIDMKDVMLIANYSYYSTDTFPVCEATPTPTPTPTPTSTPTPISCNEPTVHFSSGCELLRHYDADNDGIISYAESVKATQDYYGDIITQGEAEFVITAYQKGSINAVCPGCYTTPTPTPTPTPTLTPTPAPTPTPTPTPTPSPQITGECVFPRILAGTLTPRLDKGKVFYRIRCIIDKWKIF